jgi:hypothetical protein
VKILNREQLCSMTADEVYLYMTGHPRPEREPEPEEFTVAIPRPTPHSTPVHLFTSLHAERPACRRRLSFDAVDCTYSKGHATCLGCLEAVSDSEAA